ncbi:extracellular solute-binding protein [Paenibacillus filicis]|uniref:Extracellular solute-binding protein n=1 Tax=Paenibacillus filicis TaxID=669464 RepID=A0ABU9DCK4_9BACL
MKLKPIGILLSASMLALSITGCSGGVSPGQGRQSAGEASAQTAGGKGELAPPKTIEEQGRGGGETSQGGKKTIVFSTFYETDFIKDAKAKYEAKHPNIQIQLTHAQAKGDDANWEANHEKFVKTTNTQMLAGKGPDLLEMDQLPIEQYVNKRALANMSDLMKNDPSFKREQYFTNILDNVKLSGSVYGMPVRFYLYGLIGDEDAISKSGVKIDDTSWTWDQFTQTMKALKQKGDREYAFLSRPEYLLSSMVKTDYAAYVDPIQRKASFDSPRFIGLMTQLKGMYDDEVISAAVNFPKTYFIEDMFSSIRNYILSGTTQNPGTFLNRKLYNRPVAEGQQPGGYFRTESTIGINANSSVQKEAWDFVKFLVSDEVQPGGFPLNKKAYDKLAQQALKDGAVKADEEGQAHGKVFKVTEADMQRLNKLVNEAVHQVEFKPSKVEEIIREESAAFFKGQKSAEAVAKLVQNRVSTYLNE